MIYRATSVRPFLCVMVVVSSLVFIFAPQYLGVIELIRVVVWPAADLENDIGGHGDPELVYDCSPDEFAHVLGEHGFTRNPLSYHATLSDQSGESWVYRNSTLAPYQTHVNTFAVDGQTHIYVHREYSTIRHPIKHLRNPGEPTLTPNGTEHVLQLLEPTQGSLHKTGLISTVSNEVRSALARSRACSRTTPTEIRHYTPSPAHP